MTKYPARNLKRSYRGLMVSVLLCQLTTTGLASAATFYASPTGSDDCLGSPGNFSL